LVADEQKQRKLLATKNMAVARTLSLTSFDPCDFFLFPRMNSQRLRGRHFQNRSKNSVTIFVRRACDCKKWVSAVPPAVAKALCLFINSQDKRMFYFLPSLERCEWALIL
jgi:hypothetical protein